jgi:hypothetical protein
MEKLRAVIVIGFALLANKACGYLTVADSKHFVKGEVRTICLAALLGDILAPPLLCCAPLPLFAREVRCAGVYSVFTNLAECLRGDSFPRLHHL